MQGCMTCEVDDLWLNMFSWKVSAWNAVGQTSMNLRTLRSLSKTWCFISSSSWSGTSKTCDFFTAQVEVFVIFFEIGWSKWKKKKKKKIAKRIKKRGELERRQICFRADEQRVHFWNVFEWKEIQDFWGTRSSPILTNNTCQQSFCEVAPSLGNFTLSSSILLVSQFRVFQIETQKFSNFQKKYCMRNSNFGIRNVSFFPSIFFFEKS